MLARFAGFILHPPDGLEVHGNPTDIAPPGVGGLRLQPTHGPLNPMNFHFESEAVSWTVPGGPSAAVIGVRYQVLAGEQVFDKIGNQLASSAD